MIFAVHIGLAVTNLLLFLVGLHMGYAGSSSISAIAVGVSVFAAVYRHKSSHTMPRRLSDGLEN